MAEQNASDARERAELVARAVEKLTAHLESVGLDAARVKLAEVFETTWVLARTHPDEDVRTGFGVALLDMWSSVEACQAMLAEMVDDTSDVVH